MPTAAAGGAGPTAPQPDAVDAAPPAMPRTEAPPSSEAGIATISVPVTREELPLSCEAAALRMGLAALGISVSEAELQAEEGNDPRPAVVDASGAIVGWGDPYTVFVGDPAGHEHDHTGYGVYFPPVLAAARRHGLPHSQGGEAVSVAAIAAAVRAGHPVIAWVESGFARPPLATWTAWDGRTIRYSLLEHTILVDGISETSVRVADPHDGTEYWVARATFATSLADFGDMAIVLAP